MYVKRLLFCFILFFLLTVRAEAATLTVGGSGQYATIQAAIDNASAGDTITVAPGSYDGFTIDKQLTIEAQNYDKTNPKNNTSEITGSVEVRGDWPYDRGPILRGFSLSAGVDKPYSIFGPASGTIEYSYIVAGSDGISYEGGGGIARDNLIENTGDDCVDVDHQTKNVLLENNSFLNCGEDGIEIRQHDDSIPSRITYTMRNNRVEGTGEDGLQIMDYDNFSNRRYIVERNLFLNNGTAAIGIQAGSNTNASYDAAPMPESLYAVNNTFVGNGGAISGGANLIAINNIFQNNNLDLKDVSGNSKVLYNLFSSAPKLVGSNNLDNETTTTAEPNLNSDYMPNAGSPAIDAGIAAYTHSYNRQRQSYTDKVLDLTAADYFGSSPDLGWRETGTSVRISPTAPPPTQTEPPLPTAPSVTCSADGDYNNDAAVNQTDFTAWQSDFVAGNASLSCFEYWRRAAPSLGIPSSPAPTAGVDTSSCLTQSGPIVKLSGNQKERYDRRSNQVAKNTKIDARDAVWEAQWPVQESFDYPVIIAGDTNICFSGGEIIGNYPEQIGDPHATWDRTHNSRAVGFRSPDFVIEKVRIHNFGDGISLKESEHSSFTIRGVYLSHIRDDCVENDHLRGGFIEDSLFDGCYTGFSTRTECPSCDGSGRIMTIKDSLVRMEPMYGVYKNRGQIPGHGSFFKWTTDTPSTSPKLRLYNNVFRADQHASGGGLGLPKGKIDDCQNNTLVWLGPGTAPQPESDQDPIQNCFTITTDKSVWDSAVAEWKQSHGY